MHLLMSIMAAIGFLYSDESLKVLLTDSGAFAGNTVSMILQGKDFDRGVCAFEILEETLSARLY